MSVNPKIHKISRMMTLFHGWQVRPECKVDNVTYCYGKSTNWNEVTCKRCLRNRYKHLKEKNEQSNTLPN